MPVIQVQLIRGYDKQTLTTMASRLTQAVRATIAAPPESVTVFIHQVEPAAYMRGGQSADASPGNAVTSATASEADAQSGHRSPGAALADAGQIVIDFLGDMEARNLDAAQRRLAPEFTMEFPGGARFRRLEELVRWGKGRYQSIGKTIENTEQVFGQDQTTVWCYGTLAGVWLNGEPFSGIRFVDRFTVKDGLLTSQLVWNDIGQHSA